jgi:hypothetical protein
MSATEGDSVSEKSVLILCLAGVILILGFSLIAVGLLIETGAVK